MSEQTGISWTDATWNPMSGCSDSLPCFERCYARRMTSRLRGRFGYDAVDPFKVTLHRDRLEEPFAWKKPQRVFVCSMGDLFHPRVPWDFIEDVFDVMEDLPHLTFQLLSKRPGRMAYFAEHILGGWWPENVWAGTSVESAKYLPRLDVLAKVPAKVRFVSCEPLLESLDLRPWIGCAECNDNPEDRDVVCACGNIDGPVRGTGRILDWVIVGGESGPGARPMHPDWARCIRDDCQQAGVPFFFKQWGEWAPCTTGRDSGWETAVPENRWMYERLLGPEGQYVGRPSDQRIKVHWWDAVTSVDRVGKENAGRFLDGRQWKEMPA